jgi:hypothetical protein
VIDALAAWSRRRWTSAVVATVTTILVLGIPTDLISNPIFDRKVEAPWWTWPALLITSLLSGLLFATYVKEPGGALAEVDRDGKRGIAGGVLTFFAVGCPVCNKVVILALGYAGALKWFEPVQPLLGAVAIGLLVWAVRARLRGQLACAVPPTERAEVDA